MVVDNPEEPKRATAKEINKLDDDIGENLNLFERLKRKNNQRTLLIILLVLLLIIGFAFFAEQRTSNESAKDPGNSDPNSPAVGVDQFDFTTTDFIPKFSDLRDVVFYQGFTWAASNGGLIKYDDNEVEFFGAADGLTGEVMTSLAVANGTLWVAYQGGVARYDDSTSSFVSYLDTGEGILNPKLYYDETSDTLMLSAFDGFYIYNPSKNIWQLSADNNAPIDSSYFAADNSGVYAVNKPNHTDGGQVVKYSRSSKTWRDVSPSQINGKSTQVFNVGKLVVVLGEAFDNINRTTNYAYRDGTIWRSIAEYNEALSSGALYMIGPRIFDKKHVRVESGNGKFEVFELLYDKEFKFISRGETENSGIQDETLFEQIRKQIAEISGLRPEYRILGVDETDGLIATYKNDALSTAADGLLYLKNSFENEIVLAKFESPKTVVPIICDGVFRYVFTGVFSELDNSWQASELYRVDNTKLSKITDIESNTLNLTKAEPQFICRNSKLYYVGPKAIWYIDENDLTLNKSASLTIRNGLYEKSNDKFIVFSGKKLTKAIELFDARTEKLSKISVAREFDGRLNVAFANNRIWIPSPRTETIHVYDITGVDAKSLIHEGVNGVHILQAGQNQVIIGQFTADNSTIFSFVDTSEFTPTNIDNLPVSPSIFSEDSPISVFQPREQKIWVSGLSSSVFSLSQ